MKFFKSRKKIATEDVTRTLSAMGKTTDETVADLRRKLDAAVVPELSEGAKKAIASTSGASVVTKAADKKVSNVKLAGKPVATSAMLEAEANPEADTKKVQLFPGFEDQPFEMGYDAAFASKAFGLNKVEPMLVMRWKDGDAQWFPVPPMFNKEMLVKIHERDNDLDRLLMDYGYDAEQLARPSMTMESAAIESAPVEAAPVAAMTDTPAVKK